jgi:cobalt transporter subunit CbtA
MLTRVLSVGLLAGLLVGLAVAVLQQVTTTPLILIAETYEKPSEGHSAVVAPRAGDHQHVHAHGSTSRFLSTGIMTVATAVGVSFLLLAGMLFAGDPIDERRSLAWAVAGFVTTGLAPAAGLAPELPGSASADLVGRQVWWIGTVLATAAALWMFLRSSNVVARLLAIVVLLAPHLIGAPHPDALESKVPAELAARFAALSLAVQAALWALAGIAIGLLWSRFAPKSAT